MYRLPTLLVLLLSYFLIDMGHSLDYRGSESYMSDVNLERFYLMEENVMSNADVLMRRDFYDPEDEETEEEHEGHALNVTEMERIMERAKDLHTEVGPDLGNFLGHPINVYHLFRRLNEEWKKGLDLLLQSTPCKKWKVQSMRRYLNFLKKTVPSEADTKKVVKHLTRLQRMYRTPTQEVADGRLGNSQAMEPLGVEDQYHFGSILYDEEDIPAALSWFEVVDEWMKSASDSDREELSFKKSDLLKKMTNGYYTVGRIDDAVEAARRHLDLDKSNSRLLDNLNFFLMKQALQQVNGPPKRQRLLNNTGPKTKMERICAGQEFKLSRKHCYLQPIYGSPGWYCHKKEVLRRRPEIAIYHNVIGKFTMELLRDYTHSKITNRAWISPSQFVAPELGIEISYSELPRDKVLRYYTQKLSQAFSRVPGPKMHLLKGWGRMRVLNTGRTGFHMKRYEKELHLIPRVTDKAVGAMFAFLSEPKQGGEIVMRNWRVVSPAPKGSILVYYPTDTRPHSLCPTLGGSQWVAVQPFYEKDPKISMKRRRPTW